jgi:porphyrinogen peroxidase
LTPDDFGRCETFVGDPPGTTDRLLEVSTAVTGSLFFVPTVDQLEGD